MNQPGCHLGCQPRVFVECCYHLRMCIVVPFFLARSQDMFLNVLIRWSKVCFWYEAGKLQQKKQKQLEEEVVDEVEKSSLLSGLVLNFEFPKGGDVKCLWPAMSGIFQPIFCCCFWLFEACASSILVQNRWHFYLHWHPLFFLLENWSLMTSNFWDAHPK